MSGRTSIESIGSISSLMNSLEEENQENKKVGTNKTKKLAQLDHDDATISSLPSFHSLDISAYGGSSRRSSSIDRRRQTADLLTLEELLGDIDALNGENEESRRVSKLSTGSIMSVEGERKGGPENVSNNLRRSSRRKSSVNSSASNEKRKDNFSQEQTGYSEVNDENNLNAFNSSFSVNSNKLKSKVSYSLGSVEKKKPMQAAETTFGEILSVLQSPKYKGTPEGNRIANVLIDNRESLMLKSPASESRRSSSSPENASSTKIQMTSELDRRESRRETADPSLLDGLLLTAFTEEDTDQNDKGVQSLNDEQNKRSYDQMDLNSLGSAESSRRSSLSQLEELENNDIQNNNYQNGAHSGTSQKNLKVDDYRNCTVDVEQLKALVAAEGGQHNTGSTIVNENGHAMSKSKQQGRSVCFAPEGSLTEEHPPLDDEESTITSSPGVESIMELEEAVNPNIPRRPKSGTPAKLSKLSNFDIPSDSLSMLPQSEDVELPEKVDDDSEVDENTYGMDEVTLRNTEKNKRSSYSALKRAAKLKERRAGRQNSPHLSELVPSQKEVNNMSPPLPLSSTGKTLRGILSCKKEKRNTTQTPKQVVFGSPDAALFYKHQPSRSITPMTKQDIETWFPNVLNESKLGKQDEDEEEDEVTKGNSDMLAQWDDNENDNDQYLSEKSIPTSRERSNRRKSFGSGGSTGRKRRQSLLISEEGTMTYKEDDEEDENVDLGYGSNLGRGKSRSVRDMINQADKKKSEVTGLDEEIKDIGGIEDEPTDFLKSHRKKRDSLDDNMRRRGNSSQDSFLSISSSVNDNDDIRERDPVRAVDEDRTIELEDNLGTLLDKIPQTSSMNTRAEDGVVSNQNEEEAEKDDDSITLCTNGDEDKTVELEPHLADLMQNISDSQQVNDIDSNRQEAEKSNEALIDRDGIHEESKERSSFPALNAEALDHTVALETDIKSLIRNTEKNVNSLVSSSSSKSQNQNLLNSENAEIERDMPLTYSLPGDSDIEDDFETYSKNASVNIKLSNVTDSKAESNTASSILDIDTDDKSIHEGRSSLNSVLNVRGRTRRGTLSNVSFVDDQIASPGDSITSHRLSKLPSSRRSIGRSNNEAVLTTEISFIDPSEGRPSDHSEIINDLTASKSPLKDPTEDSTETLNVELPDEQNKKRNYSLDSNPEAILNTLHEEGQNKEKTVDENQERNTSIYGDVDLDNQNESFVGIKRRRARMSMDERKASLEMGHSKLAAKIKGLHRKYHEEQEVIPEEDEQVELKESVEQHEMNYDNRQNIHDVIVEATSTNQENLASLRPATDDCSPGDETTTESVKRTPIGYTEDRTKGNIQGADTPVSKRRKLDKDVGLPSVENGNVSRSPEEMEIERAENEVEDEERKMQIEQSRLEAKERCLVVMREEKQYNKKIVRCQEKIKLLRSLFTTQPRCLMQEQTSFLWRHRECQRETEITFLLNGPNVKKLLISHRRMKVANQEVLPVDKFCSDSSQTLSSKVLLLLLQYPPTASIDVDSFENIGGHSMVAGSCSWIWATKENAQNDKKNSNNLSTLLAFFDYYISRVNYLVDAIRVLENDEAYRNKMELNLDVDKILNTENKNYLWVQDIMTDKGGFFQVGQNTRRAQSAHCTELLIDGQTNKNSSGKNLPPAHVVGLLTVPILSRKGLYEKPVNISFLLTLSYPFRLPIRIYDESSMISMDTHEWRESLNSVICFEKRKDFPHNKFSSSLLKEACNTTKYLLAEKLSILE